MATEEPALAIEAPKQDPSYIVNENELSVVPVPNPGPVIPSKGPTDTVTQQPVGANTFNLQSDKKEIPQGFQRPTTSPSAGNAPPSNTVLAAGEQQTQRENVRTKVEVEALGSGAVHMKGTRQHVQEIKREQAVCTQDEQGNMKMIKRTVLEQRIYTEIYEVLFIEANKTNLKSSSNRREALPGSEDYEADATCGEKTVDLCCQSLVCHFQNPFKKDATIVKKNQLMNATRRRGRAKGWTILKGLVFPFVSDTARDFWVTLQLLFTFVLLSLSTSVFALAGENYGVFHAVHLAFSTLAAFLAILDSIVTFVQCSTYKTCSSRCGKKSGEEDENDMSGNDKNAIDERGMAANVNFDVESPKRCRKCFEASRSGLDVARVLLTEFILVPIIFCDMFEVATGKGFNSNVIYHQIGFALLVFDSIGLIIFVFLLRLVILGRMIRAEQKMHPTQTEQANTAQNVSCEIYNVDESVKKNSLKILVVFFLHVFGQTLAHTLMLVAVGAKIAYDTRNFGTRFNSSITNQLWYMMVAAYILPTLGIGMFFIVNNYWVQQFLIGVCIDFVKLLRICEDDHLINWSTSEERPSEAISKFVRMNNVDNKKTLQDEYKEMRDSTNFCNKFGYPFKSPVLVIICILYFLAQFAFVICTVDAVPASPFGNRNTLLYLNGGEWFYYVFVASALGAIINIYAFLVALAWLVVIAMVIAAIAALIACCICLFVCAVGDSD